VRDQVGGERNQTFVADLAFDVLGARMGRLYLRLSRPEKRNELKLRVHNFELKKGNCVR
jgi:hypothetical protein